MTVDAEMSSKDKDVIIEDKDLLIEDKRTEGKIAVKDKELLLEERKIQSRLLLVEKAFSCAFIPILLSAVIWVVLARLPGAM